MITFDLMMTCIIIMKMTLSWYNRRTGKNEREENKKKKKKVQNNIVQIFNNR